jgi:hypothetical protein
VISGLEVKGASMKKVKFPEFKSTDGWYASQLVAVMSLGFCVAIKDGTVSIGDAEQHLFNPWMLSQFDVVGHSRRRIGSNTSWNRAQ